MGSYYDHPGIFTDLQSLDVLQIGKRKRLRQRELPGPKSKNLGLLIVYISDPEKSRK